MSREIIRTPNLAQDAAIFILREARRAIGERGEFRLALSGGKTPGPIYAEFGRTAGDLSWEQVRFTFGDERCVPPEHEESNFRMAHEMLFKPFGVPEKSILRLRGEIAPALAAQEYADELSLLATQRGEMIYRHDLILLGMGDDGHTASLFPKTVALDEQIQRVMANYVPKLESWRLTMTLPLINQARHILFLIGEEKSPELLERVLAEDAQYPASRVRPPNGELTWMISA